MCLFYSKAPISPLVGYADAGYLSDPHKAYLQTGYVFTCGGTAISWRSMKQTMIATSSNHSEILAIHEASRECIWHEEEFIKKIVEKISSVLNHTYLHVAIHPVGIDSPMEYMNSLLRARTNDVRMVVICGIGGKGKTTIAKAVFKHLFHSFESKSFLANVRENSKHHKTQICLQKQLLYDILKIEVREVGSVDQCIEVIKNRLCNKRVLILDDVDQPDQLTAFIFHLDKARKDFFGSGSRIIITTRNQHLLKHTGVNDTYMVDDLIDNESLELFSWHTFDRSDPGRGYVQLSKDVIGYSQGLPLALEVLDYATKILDGCGFSATSGIGVLTRRCLLTINKGNLMMHNLLRDMGREIVCQEPVNYPGQRSRLWHCEDIINVVKNCMETDQIEGLAIGPMNEVMKDEAFKRLQNLRLLQLNFVNIAGNCEHLSKELRWLYWHGFPLNSIPKNFYQEKLVALDM
ncbi:disease resistance protein RUN1-like [Cornus florida]|uniref:disease resistance protein RUN1-like n=1 Tax=Cornus florida TaxID=4283 RepID=UPI00289DBB1C|nr:disease resistance protein RUN1-like [Cornus florida]